MRRPAHHLWLVRPQRSGGRGPPHGGRPAHRGKPLPERGPGEEEWDRRKGEWLPSPEDKALVASLQGAVREPGKIANWLARPARGIKGLPFEYEYVRLD
jgi:hypothetical protein